VSLRLPSEIAAQLADAFGDAEVIVLHSAPRTIGWVAGGVEGIASALFSAARGRTLVVPTFTVQRMDPSTWFNPPAPPELWDAIRDELPIYDPDRSPPRGMGKLAEQVWRAEGAIRSSHPVESIAAVGPRAAEIARPHPIDDPMGPRSPWARLHALDARIVLVGVGLERCSILHHAERMAEVAYIAAAAYGMPVVIDGERRWVEAESGNNCSDGFPALEPSISFEEFRVGDASVKVASARALVDTARTELARDAGSLLCRRDGCVACDAARRAIAASATGR
jgi:aminoglycoside 3-N-acetyltransferase